MIIKKTNEKVAGIDVYVSPFLEKVSQSKGITMVALIITIVILLILAGVTISNLGSSSNVTPYNNMIADIKLLEDKISIYYNKYEEIPKIENTNQTINGVSYYKIDLTKLENVTLNYGTGDNEDVYLVNDNLEVYYLKGIEKLEKIHHTRVD